MAMANANQHHAKSHAVRGVMEAVYPPVAIGTAFPAQLGDRPKGWPAGWASSALACAQSWAPASYAAQWLVPCVDGPENRSTRRPRPIFPSDESRCVRARVLCHRLCGSRHRNHPWYRFFGNCPRRVRPVVLPRHGTRISVSSVEGRTSPQPGGVAEALALQADCGTRYLPPDTARCRASANRAITRAGPVSRGRPPEAYRPCARRPRPQRDRG